MNQVRYNRDVGIVSFIEARRAVEAFAASCEATRTERVPLTESRGRVLASAIVADRDLPPFARVTRDGYAVRAADVVQVPARLRVLGEIRAGVDPREVCGEVGSGEAVAIMTGAALPSGADAVVMVEYTSSRDGGWVEVSRGVATGENVVPAGAEARQGATLLKRGTRLNFAAIATAASVGRTEIEVFARPRVAVLTTGDEIVSATAKPGAYQIRNSNAYSLAAQVAAAGGEAKVLPIAPDEPTKLGHLIGEGLKYDLLLVTGGVSAGKYDLVEPAFAEHKAQFHFTGAQIQPGKPIVFGEAEVERRRVPFFGLPGNPVSTMVCFELFVRPVLEGLCGGRPRPLLFLKARLGATVKTKTGLTRFLPALLSGEASEPAVALVPWQGSGDVVATARANCYIVIPPDREQIEAGEMVSILLRGAEF